MHAIPLRARALLALLPVFVGLVSPSSLTGAPSIQSIDVQPSPLQVGETFSIAVIASADATQGTATVDFRPWSTRVMRVVLAKQGAVWAGTGTIPADLVPPAGAEATVKAIMIDAVRASSSESIKVGVIPAAAGITAHFAGGILTVTGTPQNDIISVSRTAAGILLVNAGTVTVTGGVPTVANTTLIRILGLLGEDTLNVDESNGALPPANLIGGGGTDLMTGGMAGDTLTGGPGDDIILCGGGDDIVTWNPGDGSDTIEGQAGFDTLFFTASNAGEIMDVSSNGARVRVFRNIANVLMDCDGLENLELNLLGGSDTVVINDLQGTSLTELGVDLRNTSGLDDSAADAVIVNGTAGDDVILPSGDAAGVGVSGLAVAVSIIGSEATLDRLTINALAGDDVLEASGLAAGAINLTGNGGDDDDILIGSDGDDVLLGGAGDDVLLGGLGTDVLDGGPGDNVVIQ